MPIQFTLNLEQYEALVVYARRGATEPNQTRRLEEWLKLIEVANGYKRDLVVVKWQELDAPLPPGTFFPTKWPPELTRTIELVSRPICRDDVDRVLKAHAKNPTSVLCTRDPAGILGLTPLDDFFTG